jgi:DNA-binding NarL/FixJ family response regulator
MNRSIAIAICSPEPLFREGIRKILSQERRFLNVLATIEFDGIEPWLRQHKPEVLLMI